MLRGPGIPASLLDTVFEPFVTTKPVGKGTGLGLSQVRGLCRSTGGEALILPAPGGGTRVRLLLAQSPGPAPEPESLAVPAAPLNARVLLVEDNLEVAQATGELLQALGCHVAHAADANAALGLLKAATLPVQVLLSDIELPGAVDGLELAQQVQLQYPSLAVILTTGYAVRLQQALALKLVVLPKPSSTSMLAEAIRKGLTGPTTALH